MTQQAEPTSVSDQIEHLLAQGMHIQDKELAERCLTHIGFHRLSSYWKRFEEPSGNVSGTAFKESTIFNAPLGCYLFDQRLRSLLLEAFSFIEISIRTQWAYQLVHVFQHGEFAHQETTLFNPKYHGVNLQELESTYKQTGRLGSSVFQNLTLCEVLPVMSFGQLSKWYSSLANRGLRQSIAQIYGMDEAIMGPTLRHLTKVRNICAHHEKLWDITLSTKPKPRLDVHIARRDCLWSPGWGIKVMR